MYLGPISRPHTLAHTVEVTGVPSKGGMWGICAGVAGGAVCVYNTWICKDARLLGTCGSLDHSGWLVIVFHPSNIQGHVKRSFPKRVKRHSK